VNNKTRLAVIQLVISHQKKNWCSICRTNHSIKYKKGIPEHQVSIIKDVIQRLKNGDTELQELYKEKLKVISELYHTYDEDYCYTVR
jgi:hypothetical protein